MSDRLHNFNFSKMKDLHLVVLDDDGETDLLALMKNEKELIANKL